MDNPLKQLENFGQSPWIDMISRELLDSGALKRMVDADGLKGLTSNPTIFEKAISSGKDYDARIRNAASSSSDPKALFEAVACADIQDGADLLEPVYDKSGGADGFVSLEVSPTLAYDTEATIAEGLRLFKAVGRKNLMIKVPATKEGLPAITRLIGEGVNVNVTLIFSLARYREVMDAYLAGLERLAKAGKPLASVSSVASFFVSRIDTSVDKLLEGKKEHAGLAGKAAIANAKLAYAAFEEVFGATRFSALKAKGARA
ncbi:MAG TPA: transaldolase, partial [Elusimicrobiota bacterium]|nr:transaldolase [Elusimicrobiota bacterium]